MGQDGVESDARGLDRGVGLDQVGTDWLVGSGRTKTDPIKQYRIGSDRVRSGRIGSDRVGSDRVG